MSEHTKRPWLVRTFPTAANARRQLWIVDAIPDQGGKFVANAICSVSMTNPDAEANANLLAAAPDLLSIAVTYVADCEDTFHDIEEMNAESKALYHAAKAAIKKARGE